MVFVKTNPPWAGKVKEIPDIVDKSFWEILDKWRWWKVGAIKIDLDTDAYDAVGIRAIQENINGD